MNKKLTVKQYAKLEGITGAGVRLRIKRGTILSKKINGLTFVFWESDKTIRKPRKKKLNQT